MRTIKLLLAVFLFTGCTHLLPNESSQKQAALSAEHIQATHATEMTKQVDGNSPPITVSQSGTNNSVNVSVQPQPSQVKVTDTAGSTTIASSDQTYASKVSIPMGVKLILAGIGILILGYAIKWVITYARTQSAAVNAAWQYGDQSLASLIDHIQSKRSSASDPATQATLSDLLSVAEKERGKLNAD